ncbi:MAG: hypothetical protein A2V70_15135 [Planctomycetes bacterium RBG_13_63_9]|nr:MAG: hypothetical protein A2V70_15135 [Planctomycetes bacterium RBG_13_63_9]
MGRRISPHEEKALADRLKQEAKASRPAFSEALHARICRAVRQRQTAVPPRVVAGRSRRRWAVATAAAACLVGAVVVVWQMDYLSGRTPEAPEHARRNGDSSDPLAQLGAIARVANNTTTDVGMLMDSDLTARQWAYLDHDARVATRLLIEQLPLDMLASTDKP